MSDIASVELWFKRAVPKPTQKNLDVQNGVHAEEYGEYLAALAGNSEESETELRQFQLEVETFARKLKTGAISVKVLDREGALDAICDQLVTATGCAHMAGLNASEGLTRVNASNWSKFDENGQPIFDENGKIAKNKATYFKCDLEGLY